MNISPQRTGTDAAARAGAVIDGAARHPALRTGARIGYAANGLLHVLLGWLAIQLAVFDFHGTADQTGAFASLVQTPIGTALGIACLVGFALLALWSTAQAATARELKQRATPAVKAVVYIAMAAVAARILMGQDKSSAQNTRDATAALLSAPFGAFLVSTVGVAVIGVGGYHLYAGATQRFSKLLESHPGQLAMRLGTVGYIAKGVALLVMGALFVAAVVTHNPGRSTGIDGALRALLGLPFGTLLVVAVGLGFAAYGLFSFALARHARV